MRQLIFISFILFSNLIFAQSTNKVIVDTTSELDEQVEKVSKNKKYDTNSVYIITEESPEFTNYRGESSKNRIQNFINDNIKHPKQIDCKGTIIVRVIVEKDGSLTHFEILRDKTNCNAARKEAKRIIKLFPKWKPGKMKGLPVRAYTNILINF